jgi:peptidoglycan/xylan/chitin deacetylase (PgdA/CDA1 family)
MSLERLHALATGLDRLFLLLLKRLRASRTGIVLTFHRVVRSGQGSQPFDSRLAIREWVFQELMLMLRKEFELVPLKQLLEESGSSGSGQRVALTFDDGWADTYFLAYPVLRHLAIPATIFLCTGLIGTEEQLPEERFARLWQTCVLREQTSLLEQDLRKWGGSDHYSGGDWASHLKSLPLEVKLLMLSHLDKTYRVSTPPHRRHFLTWEQVQEMARNGISFGSHTVRHATLTEESHSVLMEELVGSRMAIAGNIGVTADLLSYPNGACDERVMTLAREAGYTHAFTSSRGWLDRKTLPMAIPRIPLEESSLVGNSSMLHVSRARLALQM